MHGKVSPGQVWTCALLEGVKGHASASLGIMADFMGIRAGTSCMPKSPVSLLAALKGESAC